jgi:poly-gamma-glutamate synthesis protein (capsule biosynthesis protein)
MSERSGARLLFAGDLCAIHRVNAMLADGDVEGAFGDALGVFRKSDLAVVNLEAPLCRREAPIAKLGPNFRSDPAVARALKSAGVDVCCLANNHVMDQGARGLRETLRVLKAAGLPHVGAGTDFAAACAPLRVSAKGVRLTLFNAGIVEGALSDDGPGAARLNPLALRRDVAAEAARGAVVIPVVHAGREEVLFPSPGMRLFCRDLIDAGAAAVVGHHPHVPQGIETYRGRPIAYSLGNFLFDWPEPEPHTDCSFLLELRVGARGVTGWETHPFRKSATGGAELLRGRARTAFLKLLDDLSMPLADDKKARRMWIEQCRPQLVSEYMKRLARGVDLTSSDSEKKKRAQLTFLHYCSAILEHAEVIESALRSELTQPGRSDRAMRRTLDCLNRRLREMGEGTKR